MQSLLSMDWVSDKFGHKNIAPQLPMIIVFSFFSLVLSSHDDVMGFDP